MAACATKEIILDNCFSRIPAHVLFILDGRFFSKGPDRFLNYAMQRNAGAGPEKIDKERNQKSLELDGLCSGLSTQSFPEGQLLATSF